MRGAHTGVRFRPIPVPVASRGRKRAGNTASRG
jgi:hypothetical protein